jgi:hypothetical protein
MKFRGRNAHPNRGEEPVPQTVAWRSWWGRRFRLPSARARIKSWQAKAPAPPFILEFRGPRAGCPSTRHRSQSQEFHREDPRDAPPRGAQRLERHRGITARHTPQRRRRASGGSARHEDAGAATEVGQTIGFCRLSTFLLWEPRNNNFTLGAWALWRVREESGRGRLRVCATSVAEKLFLRGSLVKPDRLSRSGGCVPLSDAWSSASVVVTAY